MRTIGERVDWPFSKGLRDLKVQKCCYSSENWRRMDLSSGLDTILTMIQGDGTITDMMPF